MIAAVISLTVVLLLVFRVLRRRGHKITRPELRNRAIRESERLIELVEEQKAGRPENDPVLKDHELSHRRVTFYDEEMQEIYHREHLAEISELKDLFAQRGIRNRMLENLEESVENEADLRTISTALEEMSTRLKS